MAEIVHPVDAIMAVETCFPILLAMSGDEFWFSGILCVAANTGGNLKIIELLSMTFSAIYFCTREILPMVV